MNPTDPPRTFEDHFQILFAECLQVLVERQKKYGPRNIPRFGVYGTVVRLTDKMERLINLSSRGAIEYAEKYADESLEDTLVDIANYATIARAQLRGWWTMEACPPLRDE